MNPSVLPWPGLYMQDMNGSLTPHHARQSAAQRHYYAPYDQAPHSNLVPPPNFGAPPEHSAGYQMGNDASMGMFPSYNPIYQSFPPQHPGPAGSHGNYQNAANSGNAASNSGGAESQMQ
jgi:hypothetical protein